jgi:outer membrane protein assembly factor BamA
MDNGAPQMLTTAATRGALVGVGRTSVSFDFRAREFAVMTGTALSGSFDLASPSFGSDLRFWRAGAGFEQGIKFFRSHNLVYSAYVGTGRDLPFWNEFTAGGPNLRGYLFQQFRGDTSLGGKVEYHFPLFSIKSLDFRALAFYDAAAVWFRTIPTGDAMGMLTRSTPDARNFDSRTDQGFNLSRDAHNAVGGGLRFFLRSVAIPLVGFDAGYGIEARHWRFFLVLGA